MNKEYGETRTASLWEVLNDLKKNIKVKDVIWVAVFSVAFVLLIFFLGDLCMKEIRNLLLAILPNLLGFTIAVYTIVFSFGKEVCKRMKRETADGEKPFEILHASFAFGLVFQGFSLIIGLLSKIMLKYINENVVIFTCWFLLFFSIIWVVHCVFYLYPLRTFTFVEQENKD